MARMSLKSDMPSLQRKWKIDSAPFLISSLSILLCKSLVAEVFIVAVSAKDSWRRRIGFAWLVSSLFVSPHLS